MLSKITNVAASAPQPRGPGFSRNALNRRRFMQLSTALSLAPTLRAVPFAAAPTAGSATSAQMLWASLRARTRGGPQFVGLASGFGIPQNAARGIYANPLYTRIPVAHGAARLASRTAPVSALPATAPTPAAQAATGNITTSAPSVVSTPAQHPRALKRAKATVDRVKRLGFKATEDDLAPPTTQTNKPPAPLDDQTTV